MQQAYAHSDNEYDKDNKLYVIKTLPYRGKNTGKWIRRLEAWMNRGSNTSGKAAQGRLRKLPRAPQPSRFKAPPVQLPLDYYCHQWYNGLSAVEKEKYVKHTQVALLPDASQSFIPPPNTHPDEKLSGVKFNKKYYDQIKARYHIHTPKIDDDADSEGPVARGDQINHAEEMEDSIDLEAASEGSDEEDKAANSLFFEEGEFGDVYSSDEEEDGDWVADKADESEGSESSSSEDEHMAAGNSERAESK